MIKKWQTVASDPAQTEALMNATGLPRAACAVLTARGITSSAEADHFLQPRLSQLADPFLLPDMEAAVHRLRTAVERGERVLVYGDYDVDGITSTALMVKVLSALGAVAIPFLPHRVEDGYGLGVEPVRRCLAEFKPDCILTVDCGTSSVEAVEVAQAAGVDVIITDHHEPGERVAPAHAVVNPKRNGVVDAHRHLAGVGVAFKLCHALLKTLRDAGAASAAAVDLRKHLDLVAVGTIADMVELSHENRILARHGLAQASQTDKIGLKALCKVAKTGHTLDPYHVGFLIAPRLNAAGRLGTAEAALQLLLSQDAEEAAVIADELDAANRDRQQVEKQMVEEAFQQIDATFDAERDYAVVAAQRGWHPGVVGIVASRLCQRYVRPAIVIAIDDAGVGRGSCRSLSAFNMVEGLARCSDLLVRHGGHAMAAGLQVEETNIDAFRQRFHAVAQAVLKPDDLCPEQRIDAWISLREADRNLLECLAQMQPFGLGNPKPVWAVQGARVLGAPRVLKEKHLKFEVLEGNMRLDAIAFNMAEQGLPDGPIDVAFQLDLNQFNGRESIQLKVQDVRPSTGAA